MTQLPKRNPFHSWWCHLLTAVLLVGGIVLMIVGSGLTILTATGGTMFGASVLLVILGGDDQ